MSNVLYPVFLDIEASSLNFTSYPIEIAWSNKQGTIESFLINPSWINDWKDWDASAQGVHGISLDMCRKYGIHPRMACKKLASAFPAGMKVYASGGAYDQFWIDRIFEAYTPLGYSQFGVFHSDDVMLPLLHEIDVVHRQAYFENLKVQARKKVDGQHRAKVDVEYLLELYKLCLGQHLIL